MIKLTDLLETYNGKYTIYCDLDGVLCDFDEQFKKASNGIHPRQFEDKYGTPRFWSLVIGKGIQFWENMPWTSDGQKLWNAIKNYKPIILTAIPQGNKETTSNGKQNWVKHNLGQNVKVIIGRAKDKQQYANATSILIDDREKNIMQWEAAGGIGILHTNANSSIASLNKLK